MSPGGIKKCTQPARREDDDIGNEAESVLSRRRPILREAGFQSDRIERPGGMGAPSATPAVGTHPTGRTCLRRSRTKQKQFRMPDTSKCPGKKGAWGPLPLNSARRPHLSAVMPTFPGYG
ncbi:hypothetical protein MRX96_006574 [Rhipicephalus microplus]